jgi:hypothetical protein
MTTSNLRQYPASTPNPNTCHGSTLRVLCPAPFSTLPKQSFENQNRHWARQWSSQPSMTEDSAIRIELHSAEVVHFTHTIRYIRWDSTTDCHTQVCGVRIIDHSLPSIHLNMGAYPVEYTSPANPSRLPLPSIVPVPQREKPKCFPDR